MMDPRAFDELSKKLAEKTSRGRALKLFGGALVGTFVGAGTAKAHPPQKHCKYARYSCQRNIDCCSNNCCNRICCDDGMTCCGGECIRCPAGQSVDPNTCQCVGGNPGPVCGNGVCEAGETCTSCPQDCGQCPPNCGNGICDAGEDPCNCPQDCPGVCPGQCGNGVCEPEFGEHMGTCPEDCTQPVCGNTFCEPGEDFQNCPEDCPPVGTCGNGFCDIGEDVNCPDCPPGVCPQGGNACLGTAGACSQTNPACICAMTTTGTTSCADFSGAVCGVAQCITDLECPGGQMCFEVSGCCGGASTTLCAPPCTS